jgi:hypothetical protein
VKTLTLAAAAVWSLAAPVAPGSGLVWDRFVDARVAYTLRLPRGWHATVLHGGTVITSVPVANVYDNPERVRLPRGGAYVWIFDYGRLRGDFPERPERFQLGRREAHSCGFGEGYMLHFRDRGHVLQVFVKLGPSAEGRSALAVLDSLRVTP